MHTPTLAPRFARELAAANPLGVSITPEEVQSWAEIIWPKFRRRGYRRVNLALSDWWSRITMHDIERARDRLRNQREEAENRRLESLAQRVERTPPTCPPRQRFRVVAGGRHG
jgi:hypothetical protein